MLTNVEKDSYRALRYAILAKTGMVIGNSHFYKSMENNGLGAQMHAMARSDRRFRSFATFLPVFLSSYRQSLKFGLV